MDIVKIDKSFIDRITMDPEGSRHGARASST